MSIDARVQSVVVHRDGSGELHLVDRPVPADQRRFPGEAGIAGQAVLYFKTAPPDVSKLQGQNIWGGSNDIMLNEVKIGDREGYTAVRFVVDSIAKAMGEK
jgi:hypothetical protein